MFLSNSLAEDKLGLCFAVLVTLKKDRNQTNGYQMEEKHRGWKTILNELASKWMEFNGINLLKRNAVEDL